MHITSIIVEQTNLTRGLREQAAVVVSNFSASFWSQTSEKVIFFSPVRKFSKAHSTHFLLTKHWHQLASTNTIIQSKTPNRSTEPRQKQLQCQEEAEVVPKEVVAAPMPAAEVVQRERTRRSFRFWTRRRRRRRTVWIGPRRRRRSIWIEPRRRRSRSRRRPRRRKRRPRVRTTLSPNSSIQHSPLFHFAQPSILRLRHRLLR